MAGRRLHSSIGLMAVGMLAMTVLADVVEPGPIAVGLAGGGGAVFLVSGMWWLQLLDDRNRVDERFLQIGFRASMLSLWSLFVGLMTFSNVENVYEVTYPVFSNYTWLLLVGLLVFVTAWTWYNRRM